jgi:hypothetical protein
MGPRWQPMGFAGKASVRLWLPPYTHTLAHKTQNTHTHTQDPSKSPRDPDHPGRRRQSPMYTTEKAWEESVPVSAAARGREVCVLLCSLRRWHGRNLCLCLLLLAAARLYNVFLMCPQCVLNVSATARGREVCVRVSLCVFECVCVHLMIHTHTHTHTQTHTRLHVCIHIYAYTHIYLTQTQTHTLICVYIHTHRHMCAYTHTHTHTHTLMYIIYTYTYIYIYRHTDNFCVRARVSPHPTHTHTHTHTVPQVELQEKRSIPKAKKDEGIQGMQSKENRSLFPIY